jgi:hypothetical protein
MRRSIQVMLALVAVAAAFEVGRRTSPPDHSSARSSEPPWSDFQAPAVVTSWGFGDGPNPPKPNRYELVPYRMLVDGNRVFDNLDGEPKTGDVWQINLADNRIKILAVRRIPHEAED